MKTLYLEWIPCDHHRVFRDTADALDTLVLSKLLRTHMSSGLVSVVLDVKGDAHAAHAAVDELRTKVKRYAVDGVVQWLQPKETT
ncbi:MAG: hypothetical protein V3W41_21880 [Planctomycetota bacterium]